jgi:prefoldin subunit 5
MIGCADESFSTWYDTNSSFGTRISEIISAKQQLEKQLEKVRRDIDHLNRQIDKVRKALDEKLPVLKVNNQKYYF